MKRIIISASTLLIVAAAVVGATGAFFNDTETSTDNIFTAGSIDLQVDHYFQEYNGEECEGFCEPVGGDIAVNGGFEDPEVTHSANWDIFESVPGWSIEWVGSDTEHDGETRPDPALVEYQDGVNGWNSYEGDQWVELDSDWFGPDGLLNGEPASVRISQDIPTEVGKKYRVTFAFSPRPGTGSGENQLKVSWDGSHVATESATGGSNTDWEVITYDLVATDTSTTLSFEDAGTENSLGTFLDAVTVEELSCDFEGNGQCQLWEETDLTDEKFFHFNDIKPGDSGRNGISLHVYDNDAWSCLLAHDGVDDENTVYESEGDDDDTAGELQDYIEFFTWIDTDADGVYDEGETGLDHSTLGDLSSIASLDSINGEYLTATTTANIGLAWCAGNLDPETLECDGSGMLNDAQSDSFSASLTAYAEQTRNNEDFKCADVDLGGDGDDEGDTEVVTESDLETEDNKEAAWVSGDWFFYNDSNDTIMSIDEFSGSGGENHMDSVAGSSGAKMLLHDAGARYNIATYRYNDVALADIDTLKYRVYDASASSQTPFLNFNVDFVNDDSWQNRLVHVPGASGNPSVPANTWTTVDALGGGNAMWTWSGYAGNGNQWPTETGTSLPDATDQYQKWSDIVAAYPGAETRSTDSWFGVRVGHPGPDGETSYVDWIEFDNQVSDFEE